MPVVSDIFRWQTKFVIFGWSNEDTDDNWGKLHHDCSFSFHTPVHIQFGTTCNKSVDNIQSDHRSFLGYRTLNCDLKLRHNARNVIDCIFPWEMINSKNCWISTHSYFMNPHKYCNKLSSKCNFRRLTNYNFC